MRVLAAPTLDARCGTEPGARAHNRRNEHACRACNRAVSRARRERRLAAGWEPRPMGWAAENCPGCGWYMRLQYNGYRCVNPNCSTAGVCL